MATQKIAARWYYSYLTGQVVYKDVESQAVQISVEQFLKLRTDGSIVKVGREAHYSDCAASVPADVYEAA